MSLTCLESCVITWTLGGRSCGKPLLQLRHRGYVPREFRGSGVWMLLVCVLAPTALAPMPPCGRCVRWACRTTTSFRATLMTRCALLSKQQALRRRQCMLTCCGETWMGCRILTSMWSAFRAHPIAFYGDTIRVSCERLPRNRTLNCCGCCEPSDLLLSFWRMFWVYALSWTGCCEIFKKLQYFILDPTQFGEPVARPRYYILLLRQDAAVSQNVGDIVEFIKSCLSAARAKPTQHVRQRMLPNTHEHVQTRAAAMRKSNRVPVLSGVGSKMGFTTSRQHSVFQSVQGSRGIDVIADVSQAVGLCHPRADGIRPTLTPTGICYFGLAQRPVLGCEKLWLHGFPLHRMQIPASISQRSLGLLGGNTMHLHCIGIVLLMGIALLKE